MLHAIGAIFNINQMDKLKMDKFKNGIFVKFLLLAMIAFSSFANAVDCFDLDEELGGRLAEIDHCYKLPYMNEGYIPQGIHITSSNLAYVSMYHKDVNGKSYKNSIVAEINKNNGDIKKYVLPTTGHVGGIAIYNNYSRFVVPNGRKFCIYTKSSKSTGYCQTQSIGSSKRTTGFSFIHYAPDHNGKWHMWSGQFETGTNSKDGMHIFGYAVNGSSISKTPSYRFYVPPSVNKIQGASVIAPKNATDDYKILVSSSYGDHPSKISLLKYKRYNSYHYKYKFYSSKHVYTAPAGLEEIHATANSKGVWTLLESGAQYYDKKWNSKGLPFMYRIPFYQLGL